MMDRDTADPEGAALRIMRRAVDEPPERRGGFVREACAGNAALHARVTALLAAMGDASAFLETPAIAVDEVASPAEHGRLVDQRIGQYRILRQIGAGGMGLVYLAEQDNPRRMVALKMLRSGIASARARRLFEHEAQILGRLDHPNVARVFEASTYVDERQNVSIPFFAMEYIASAVPLTAYARTNRLDRAARIALFRKACLGVHHGHQKGIVHRDLKPANIVVDAAGEPRVIDYGVAIVTAGDHGTTYAHSDGGSLVGTLKYMSPEQCRGDARRVDTRSDVHALGVVLYELLCDRFPHDLEDLSPIEITRVIIERPPLRPRVTAPDLPPDLETIVLKAMAKDPDDRYQSAADLERDLGRYLRHEPIEARPFSAVYHARLFARRHRTLIGVGSVAAVAAIAATATSIAFAITARNAERQATVQRDRALERQYMADMAAAESALRSNEFRRLRTHLDSAPPALRGWEWTYMHEQADRSLVVLEHPVIVDAVLTTRDGDHALIGGRDGQVQLRTLKDGGLVRSGQAETGPIISMALSPDGATVALTNESGHIELFELPELRRRWRSAGRHGDRARSGDVRAVAFASDGHLVVSAGRDGTVRSWGIRDGRERWVWGTSDDRDGVQFMSLTHHPTAPILAVGGTDGQIELLDSDTGLPLRRLVGHPEAEVVSMIFSPDGALLFSGANDRTIGVWSLTTGQRVRTLLGHDRSVWCLAISPDGTTLASASIDHTIRTWSMADGTALDVHYGHGDAVANVAYSPDGSRLISVSWDRSTRIWDTARDAEVIEPRREREAVDAVALSPDNRLIATTHAGEAPDFAGPVMLRDAITLDPVGTLERAGTRSRSVEFHPHDALLAIAWMDGAVTLVDTLTGEVRLTIRADEGPTLAVAFTPDGSRLVTGHRGREVRIWSSTTGELIGAIECVTQNVGRLAVAPDGTRLVTVSSGSIAQLWDLETGAEVATLDGHLEAIFAVAICPSGLRVLTGSRDQTIRVWSTTDGSLKGVMEGHGQWITGLAFTPDGSRLISASRFETITLWDAQRLEPIVTLRGHDRPLRAIAVDPRGDRVVTADDMGTIRFWDRRPRVHRKRSALLVESLTPEIGDESPAPPSGAASAEQSPAHPSEDLRRHATLNATLRQNLSRAAPSS